jgi:predicted nucleic acid-binding protein
MLEPVVKRWLENRAVIVRQVLEETITGGVDQELKTTREVLDQLIEGIEKELKIL